MACLSVLTSEHFQATRFTHQRMNDAAHCPGKRRTTQDVRVFHRQQAVSYPFINQEDIS